jgi:hypothetical protein
MTKTTTRTKAAKRSGRNVLKRVADDSSSDDTGQEALTSRRAVSGKVRADSCHAGTIAWASNG